MCGSGSEVERHLAKVDVAGSNPVSRSIIKHRVQSVEDARIQARAEPVPNVLYSMSLSGSLVARDHRDGVFFCPLSYGGGQFGNTKRLYVPP